MKETLPDFGREARERVARGYYSPEVVAAEDPAQRPSLVAALGVPAPPFPVIAEIKPASPTAGALRATEPADAGRLADAFIANGARAVSVLAEHARFGGSPLHVAAAAATGAPVLFKDFVVDPAQLDCARRAGAAAVLVILDLVPDTDGLLRAARERGLETLLEVYDAAGFARALDSDADLIGINNRDLRAPGLPVDVGRTAAVLAEAADVDRPVVALSGVSSKADVARVAAAGADAALIGSVLMKAGNPAARLKELLW